MDAKKVAIYVRVSTLDQAREGYSLSAQRKTLTVWASAHNCDVIQIYADEGISAKDISHRPAMCSLLDMVKQNRVDIVLVWALSRLTRSVSDLYSTWNLLQRHNCSLVSYTESFDTSTPTGRAMMGLLGVFAQMEREITAERVKLAMAERAAQGKRTASVVLGYDLDGPDSYKINESEAECIRFIFETFLGCRNLSTVARLCHERGYTGKRGRIFKAQHIKTILTRPIYIGYNSFHGNLYRGGHTPIIERSVWDEVQKLINKNQKGPKS